MTVESYEDRERRLYELEKDRAVKTFTIGTKVYAPDDISFLIMEGTVARVEWGEYNSSGHFIEKSGGTCPQFWAKVRKAWWKDGGWARNGKPDGVRKRQLVVCDGRYSGDDIYLSQGTTEWKFFADRQRAAARLVLAIERQLDEVAWKKADLEEQLRAWKANEL